MQTSDEGGLVLAVAPEILGQAIEIALDTEDTCDIDITTPAEDVAADDTGEVELPAILEEVLIEEVSIDGMCGVY